MSKFRTEVNLEPPDSRIHLADSILTIGSCFSDAIGSQLISNKMNACINPFGTTYNPHSIHKLIDYAISNGIIPENSFLERAGVFFHYDFHSEFSSLDLRLLKERLQCAISAAHTFLSKTRWLIITYGTAWVFELNSSGELVANCHKMPQQFFNKSLLTEEKILSSFDSLYQRLKQLNPGIQIMLTVSPVRHLKETLELNSVSKSILRVACHLLKEQYRDVHYFPAYEILMDDLRDYRFYKADMIHPSDIAEEYVWEKFVDQYFDDKLKNFLQRWKAVQASLNHKPFHPSSSPHQQFIRATITELEELNTIVNVEEEIAMLRKQLS